MGNYMEPLFAEHEARERAAVLADIWGHLEPRPGRVYRGSIVFARSEYDERGAYRLIRTDFDGEPNGPLFYEELQAFIEDVGGGGGLGSYLARNVHATQARPLQFPRRGDARPCRRGSHMKTVLQALPVAWTPDDIVAAGRFFLIMLAVFSALALAEWVQDRRGRRAAHRQVRVWPRFDAMPDAAELQRRQAARRAMERPRSRSNP